MTGEPLYVLGIGAEGPASLSAEAHAHIAAAKIMAGGRRHLDFFPDWRGERMVIDANLDGFIRDLRERCPQRKTVVLASGDPLFFGIGRLLLESFPREDLMFLPQLSSIQLAFARIKETWNDAQIISVHGRPLEDLLPALSVRAAKIAALTDGKNHPAAIADFLRRHGAAEEYALWVCEDLGTPQERVTRHVPATMRDEVFSPLNVVVLLKEGKVASPVGEAERVPLLGIPESALLHRAGPRGLITRREVRLLALCYLELQPADVLWDVGAGSGSVALEAARLSPRLAAWAVERDAESLSRLEANVARFASKRVRIVAGEAPESLTQMPDPDAVFIGGSGGRLRDILDVVVRRLRPGGRLVINCVTVETFSAGWDWLHAHCLNPEATSVQLSHTRPLGRLHCLEPDNPITILRATKP